MESPPVRIHEVLFLHDECLGSQELPGTLEFRDIAMQMLLAAMLIDAFHATLEDAVEPLKGIGVNLTTAVFASAVIDIFVARKILVKMRILASFVGHDGRFFRDIGAKDWHQMSG